MSHTIDWLDIHRKAAAAANRLHPQFELFTPEHTAWLAEFDAVYRQLLLKAIRDQSPLTK
jgi:hypothetical protein